MDCLYLFPGFEGAVVLQLIPDIQTPGLVFKIQNLRLILSIVKLGPNM